MTLFIILGIILFFVGFTLKNNVANPLSKFSNPLRIVGFALIGLGLFSSMFKQINAGKVGVQSLYGSVQSGVLESGLHK